MSRYTPWLVGAQARPFVDEDLDEMPPEQQANRAMDRARAVRVLDRECHSVVRAVVGTAAWAVGMVGVVGLTLAAWHGAPGALRVVGAVVGTGLLLAGAVLGQRVWQAGSLVVDAFCWWTLLPERLPQSGAGVAGWRTTPAVEAVQARVFMLQGGRMVRVALAVLAFLVPLAFLQQAANGSPRFPDTWPDAQTAALLVAFFGSLAVSWVAGGITFSGQVRANSAQSRRDPVSAWLARWLGGR